ncbi:hypothetical protein JD844_005921 [Phrynosoma platyrhinos]|uniref:Ras and Rab interactor-like protein n=1 Tax=Phrynosoma platyrhinos TaxID=52577 RepID=A0ABQ7TPI3_PHRPL|nr:hypothetical protein JD844_005921 [Phrynosoma platyrhinos]
MMGPRDHVKAISGGVQTTSLPLSSRAAVLHCCLPACVPCSHFAIPSTVLCTVIFLLQLCRTISLLFIHKMSESMPGTCQNHSGNEPGSQHTLVNGRCETLIPLLDRLSITRNIWDLIEDHPGQAAELLSAQPPGGKRGYSGELGHSFLSSALSSSSQLTLCYSPALGFTLPLSELSNRDILPCTLRLPDAFRLPRKSQLHAVGALGMKFWTMPLKPGNQLSLAKEEEDPIDSNGESLEASQPACSIRVTSEDGALCIINPLFLSVHSDVSWLDLAPGPCRLSSRRATLQIFNGSTEAASSKQGVQQCQNHPRSQEEEEEEMGKGDVLALSASARRKLLLRSLACSTSEDVSEDLPSSPGLHQKEIKSPHRVSWIEGIPAEIPPAWSLKKSSSESSLLSESLLLPPIPELDSLSVSSIEDEPEGFPLTPATLHKRQGRSSAVLTHKVFHRLSAVGTALGSFLSAERRVTKRVQELAQEPTSYVGGLIQSFVGHILRGGGMRHPTSTDMLQEIRQMISNLKGYLCESSELRTICEHGEAEEIDLGMEWKIFRAGLGFGDGALYKSILKPLRDSIYTQLLDFRSRDGTVDKLREHQVTMSKQSLAELGVISSVPDAAGLERIQTKLDLLHQAYSPRKKETQMLKVCKMLYEAMNQTAGKTEPFGADDFLPVLIYMLVNCDIVSVQLDVEYMMELMDPSQLQGEGGYYLTTWFGALFHIANFQPAAMITRQISIEAQHSIHQWHRRRTIHPHHHHPIRRHSQKTILVTTDMTTASVCAVCAEKYSISDCEAYGLFLVSGESSQLLAEDSYPQRLHSAIIRSKGPPGSFVYKPKDGALPSTSSLLLQDPKSLTEPLESRGMEQSVAD